MLLYALIGSLVIPAALQSPVDEAQLKAESNAFNRIAVEKNLDAKKKLAAGFEKSYPQSERLPEIYMDISRALASMLSLAEAKQYAEKAVMTVGKMKRDPAYSDGLPARQQWLDSMDAATKKNLAWVNQTIAWQSQQVRSNVLRKK